MKTTSARQGHKRRQGTKVRVAGVADDAFRDPLAAAYERERDHGRVPPWPLEEDCVIDHVFRCVCCGRLRGEQERREAQSLVCIRCVREAGYWN